MTMDDGWDLVTTINTEHTRVLEGMIGGCEETTTGVVRLRAMEKDGVLPFPVVAVNNALTKQCSTIATVPDNDARRHHRATNVLIAGRTLVVAGYGWCGRGVASRANGNGAHVIVTEVDPRKAIEATMDGFE